MGTRSNIVFNVSPYPGRDDFEPIIVTVYKHSSGYPEEVMPILLKRWETGRDYLTSLHQDSPFYLPVSLSQVVLGLVLADPVNDFRLSEGEAEDAEFSYEFSQPTKDFNSLTLKAIEGKGQIFEGGYEKFAAYVDVNYDRYTGPPTWAPRTTYTVSGS